MENCRQNLQRNGVSVKDAEYAEANREDANVKTVKVEVLRWEDPPPMEDDVWAAEVLLAADVIYDAAAAEAFAKLAAKLLNTKAERLYMSLEKRVYFSSATFKPEVAAYPQFLEDCAALGLEVEPVDLSSVPVHFNYVRSRFYELVTITAKGRASVKRKQEHATEDLFATEPAEKDAPLSIYNYLLYITYITIYI